MSLFAITIVIIIFILFIGLIFWTQSKRAKISEPDQKEIRQNWERLLKESPKNSILEADKLLDQTLKLKGYTGSLGEKMKKANNLFSDRNGIWNAHKLRNRIAHELNINISENEGRQALTQFKKALGDLGIKL